MISTKVEQRFWKHVAIPTIQPMVNCWEWQAGTFKSGGYGAFNAGARFGKKRIWRAHRFAFMLSAKADPGDKFVCHHCDNPKCVNPIHLFLGTNSDNVADMVSKARHLPGAQKHALVTADQVRGIRRMREAGVLAAEVAKIFGIKRATVYAIQHRRRWAHLDR